ncbi:MAG: tol-pal system protein YbgF [Candidatus Hydrogenedentes bacterium]|nr:tol-pal system protein YbgF [Candidatus Hydrogenedentota bacterium]
MRSCLPFALIAAIALTHSSCATAGTRAGMGGSDPARSTAYDTHRLMRNLEESVTTSVSRLNETTAELLVRIEASDREMRRLMSVAEENQVKLELLQQSIDDLTATIYKQFNLSPPTRRSIRGISRTPTSDVERGEIIVLAPPGDPTSFTTPPVEVLPPPPLDAEAHYRQAQGLYSKQDYGRALEQFSSHLALFPESKYAGNAQYWRAHCLFKLGEYETAIDEFDLFRTLYPASGKVPTSMHNQAVSFSRLGQSERAIELFKNLILQYPNDAAAESAREKLRSLQGLP